MLFIPAKYIRIVVASLSVILCFIYSNVVIAGGDPNVKDKNVSKSSTNIKQHDHKKVY